MDYMEVRARARARDPRPEAPPITCLMPDDKGGEKLTRRRTGGRAADSRPVQRRATQDQNAGKPAIPIAGQLGVWRLASRIARCVSDVP